MPDSSKLSVIVPLWNEGRNVTAFVDMIVPCRLVRDSALELVLVNNGSADDTGALVDAAAAQHPWIHAVHLPQNLNYGGGIYEGARYASHPHLGMLPGDLQYSADDLVKVWDAYCAAPTHPLLAKGWRTTRLDPLSTRIVSAVYSRLANAILGTSVRDINGLPKIFPRALLDALPAERMVTFVFDAQLLFTATRLGWLIHETEVTFHARRAGVSSWSGKRMRVYARSFMQLLRVSRLGGAPGVPMRRTP
jgi:glycosyltransferase involved in cell wall biosynthesis